MTPDIHTLCHTCGTACQKTASRDPDGNWIYWLWCPTCESDEGLIDHRDILVPTADELTEEGFYVCD